MRAKTLIFGLLLATPGAVAAQSVQEQIIAQLEAQGFTEISVQRTLLGRIRLEAQSDTLERELVFNPVTGEILRDYWEERDGGAVRAPQLVDPNEDDEDDDDE